MIRIEIPFEPIPAARPRFSGRRAYQPARNREYRLRVQWAARLAMGGREPLTGELFANLKLYRKYRRATKKFGDCDNHEKAIFDALNGIIFVDDSQICRVVVEKYQDKENPRAVIEVGALDESQLERRFWENVAQREEKLRG